MMTEFIQNLCWKLEENDPKFTSLTVESSMFYSTEMPAFLQALKNNRTLKKLSFYGVHFGVQPHSRRPQKRCMHTLAQIITQKGTQNPPLESLTFWKNGLDTEDIQILTEALKVASNIRSLRFIGNTGLNSQNITLLADVIRQSKSIEELHLFCEPIQDEGAIALASALEYNTVLETLKLFLTGISSKGVAAISRALAKNTTLTSLELQGNTFDKKMWTVMDQRLEFNRQLAQAMQGTSRLITPPKRPTITQKKALYRLLQVKPNIQFVDDEPLPIPMANVR